MYLYLSLIARQYKRRINRWPPQYQLQSLWHIPYHTLIPLVCCLKTDSGPTANAEIFIRNHEQWEFAWCPLSRQILHYITLHSSLFITGLSKENFKQPLQRNNNVRGMIAKTGLQFTTKHWQQRGRCGVIWQTVPQHGAGSRKRAVADSDEANRTDINTIGLCLKILRKLSTHVWHQSFPSPRECKLIPL